MTTKSNDLEEKRRQLNDYLSEHGLRRTPQRELILAEFLKKHEHVTVDELWARVRKKDASIGHATVYRALKLFTSLGIADRHDFGEGIARFEDASAHHHDHLICTKCGEITEFENDSIENLQEEVCYQHGFNLLSHRMELYGHCKKCRK